MWKRKTRYGPILNAVLVSALALLGGAWHVWAQPADTVVKIHVKRFDFAPSEIRLKKGVPVVLEFDNDDVVMGFSAPDLGARADVPVGKVTRVRLVPMKTGTFTFFCDVFCGTGHEEMTGTIMVE
jgi:cytochrome c oxidase subunit 2